MEMKTIKIENNRIDIALKKMELTPYSLMNDSVNYRQGYIRALQDLGIIDGLSAARMMMEIELMEWGEA